MTEAAGDQVLEALRHGWGEAYEFGEGYDGFWARRRDGSGETLIDEDPGQLCRQVRNDYAARPVRTGRQGLPRGGRQERLFGRAHDPVPARRRRGRGMVVPAGLREGGGLAHRSLPG
jgi:hypothetical protein